MAASMRTRNVSECSEESGINDGELLQELGLLEAIYVNELDVITNESGVPSELSVFLHPATAGNVDQQYVCLTLHLKLPDQYPSRLPVISIRNSRGVSDEHLASLDVKLNQLASDRQGGAMLYELIEVAKESLTNNNTPSCQCVICLHGFTEADVFTRTQCYHYFHSQCLARYIKHAQESDEEPVCAVCREPVAFDLSQLAGAPPPSSDHEVYRPGKVIRDMQRRMAALYRRQKERGGIIDIEAENNKYLINISQTPTLPTNVGISPVMSQPKTQPSAISGNDVKSDKVAASRSEGKTSSGGTESNKPSDKKDATTNRGNHSDHLRSYNRNDSRQGRRAWGRGRGSRGRGQSRPNSSGGRDAHTPASGFERNMEAKGQSSKDDGSDVTIYADQSQATSHKREDIDQSKDRIQSDRGKVLDDGRNDRQRPGSGSRGRGRPPQGSMKSFKVGDSGRHFEDKSVKPDKDITKPQGNQAAQQKPGEPKQDKSAKSRKTDKMATDSPSAIDKDKLERSKGNNFLTQVGTSKGRNEENQGSHGPPHPRSIPKTDSGSALSTESKMNRKKSPQYPDRSCDVETNIHAHKVLANSAMDSTTGASQEGAKKRPRQRHRYRQGEPSQSTIPSHSDTKCSVHDEVSQVKSVESRTGPPGTKSRDHKSSGGSPRSSQPKSSRKPAPDPNSSTRNIQSDIGQKSVRPPPGFEHVML